MWGGTESGLPVDCDCQLDTLLALRVHTTQMSLGERVRALVVLLVLVVSLTDLASAGKPATVAEFLQFLRRVARRVKDCPVDDMIQQALSSYLSTELSSEFKATWTALGGERDLNSVLDSVSDPLRRELRGWLSESQAEGLDKRVRELMQVMRHPPRSTPEDKMRNFLGKEPAEFFFGVSPREEARDIERALRRDKRLTATLSLFAGYSMYKTDLAPQRARTFSHLLRRLVKRSDVRMTVRNDEYLGLDECLTWRLPFTSQSKRESATCCILYREDGSLDPVLEHGVDYGALAHWSVPVRAERYDVMRTFNRALRVAAHEMIKRGVSGTQSASRTLRECLSWHWLDESIRVVRNGAATVYVVEVSKGGELVRQRKGSDTGSVTR